jgi:hypothetical protein
MLTSANLNIVPGQSSKGANGSESKAKMNVHPIQAEPASQDLTNQGGYE